MNHLSDPLLNEFLDGTLSPAVRGKADEHLDSCAICRLRLNEFQFLFDRLKDLPEVQVSQDLTPEILKSVPGKKPRLWTPLFAVQFGVVLGVLVWFSTQAARIITALSISPGLINRFEGFLVPKLNISRFNVVFPTLNLPSLTMNFMFTVPIFRFSQANLMVNIYHNALLALQYWINQLSGWRYPPVTTSSFFVIGVVLVLWIIGNAVLLHDHPETNK